MSSHLDVPPDLLHLIEKREREERRVTERRKAAETAASELDREDRRIQERRAEIPRRDDDASQPQCQV
ncbi:MAG: hypothetical protein H6822_16750 [Planctomycetaceae bacterium]|nr:hypothetical protein [Planctomycetales bacterium]MCB9923833.1 hypothetical protein [Planctomycetaceae bacterium]